MPNWCMNSVEVHIEDEKELKQWKEIVESEKNKFDFNKIVPMPEELNDTVGADHVPSPELIEKYGFDDWCDWRIHNWGVKWNANVGEDDVENDGDYIRYDFDTPWSPPHEIYYALKRKFPDIGITWFYYEPGMKFAGYLNDE